MQAPRFGVITPRAQTLSFYVPLLPGRVGCAGDSWQQHTLCARQFTQSAGVTGILLTKLDGTAKGGIAVAIARELNLPVRYVGVGEKMTDLLEFSPEEFVDSLLE